MAASVSLAASQHVINGTAVNASSATLSMVDSTTGQTGDGIYTISLTSAAAYVVTKGQAPAISTTQLNLAQVFVVGNSVQEVKSLVRYKVSTSAVNATVMHTADADGSYLAANVVTLRTLNAALQALIGSTAYGTSFPGSPHEGEFFFRTDLQLLALYNGSTWLFINGVIPDGASLPASGQEGELFYLTSGTVGLNIWHSGAWVAISGGGGGSTTITYGTSFPGSPVDGEPFFRTDLGYLFIYDLGTTTWMQASPSPVLSLNSLQGALSIVGPTNAGILVSPSGSSINVSMAVPSGTSDPGTPYAGQFFYRSDLTSLRMYNGSAWVTISSGGGVTSLNSLTGGLAIVGVTSGGVNVGTSGSNVDLDVRIASGTSFPGSPAAGWLFYRTDLTNLYYYNGSGWVVVVPTGAGGVSSLNALAGALSIATSGGLTVIASGTTVTIGGGNQVPGSDAGVQTAIAALSPVHWYKLAETSGAFADSGSSPSGASAVTGAIYASQQLVGGSVGLFLPNGSALTLPFTVGASAFTLAAIVRLPAYVASSSVTTYVFGSNGTGTSAGWAIIGFEGQMFIQWYSSFGSVKGPGLDIGRALLIAAIYDGTHFNLHLNGVNMTQATPSGYTAGSNNILFQPAVSGVTPTGLAVAHAFSVNSALTQTQLRSVASAAGLYA